MQRIPCMHCLIFGSLGDVWGTVKSGNTLNIRFNPDETAVTWDMRIEGADGHYAEWNNLNLGDTSQIRLRLELSPRLTAVAEVE